VEFIAKGTRFSLSRYEGDPNVIVENFTIPPVPLAFFILATLFILRLFTVSLVYK
jgi:hypothetical protein